MPSIKDQINKYQSAAGGPRNIGSDPSDRQMANAKNTAIGHIRGTIKRKPVTAAARSDLKMSVSRSSSHLRPSREGMMDAPSAWISMNGSGYSNPKAQSARYATRDRNVAPPPSALSGRSNTLKMTTDYTHKGLSKNSGKILTSIMKKRFL